MVFGRTRSASVPTDASTSTTNAPPSFEPDLDVECLIDVMVPMRDGVLLATDVYIPICPTIAPTATTPLQRLSKRFPVLAREISIREDPHGGVLVRRNSTYEPQRRYPVILEPLLHEEIQFQFAFLI